MKLTCHCGSCELNVPHKPQKLNRCSCSVCRRYGALWGYFDAATVTIAGMTDTYAWGDRAITFHRCVDCGVTTHWALNGPGDKIGVNMQNADQADLTGIVQIDSHQ